MQNRYLTNIPRKKFQGTPFPLFFQSWFGLPHTRTHTHLHYIGSYATLPRVSGRSCDRRCLFVYNIRHMYAGAAACCFPRPCPSIAAKAVALCGGFPPGCCILTTSAHIWQVWPVHLLASLCARASAITLRAVHPVHTQGVASSATSKGADALPTLYCTTQRLPT